MISSQHNLQASFSLRSVVAGPLLGKPPTETNHTASSDTVDIAVMKDPHVLHYFKGGLYACSFVVCHTVERRAYDLGIQWGLRVW